MQGTESAPYFNAAEFKPLVEDPVLNAACPGRMGMRVGCGIEKSGTAITCWGVLISNEEGKTWRQD